MKFDPTPFELKPVMICAKIAHSAHIVAPPLPNRYAVIELPGPAIYSSLEAEVFPFHTNDKRRAAIRAHAALSN